jgi:glycerophosphoryl diester phosphodiesterase
MTSSTHLVAHRGMRTFPENSLPALSHAFPCGYVELDVHLSKDGEVIVNHDNHFMWHGRYNPSLAGTLTKENFKERLTQPIFDLTLEKIKTIDIGQSFHPEFTGLVPCTLSEVLTILPQKTHLFIEFKSVNPELIHAIHACITAHQISLKQITLMSFDIDSLIFSKKMGHPYSCIYLTHANTNSPEKDTSLVPRIQQHKIEGIGLEYTPSLRKEIVTELRENQIKSYIWLHRKDETPTTAQTIIETLRPDFCNTDFIHHAINQAG